MSKPKTLAACLTLTLAVTLSPTAVAGASGAAPASGQPKAAPRTVVGPATVVNCQAGTSSGKGAAKFHVCVSSYGNVYSWLSPAGWEFINQGNNAEGFGLCGDTGSGWGPIGWDFNQGGASGFGAPTITQPTAGTFPITITRSTGVVKLKQLFTIDPKDAMLTITETLTNISAAAISDPILTRWVDIDAEPNAVADDYADLAQFGNTAVAQVDQNEDNGLQLRAGTMTVQHIARLDESPFSFTDMQNGGCANTTPTVIAPGATADYASILDYYLGGSSASLAPGASQTVVVEYQRV
jgi:hypothetical protein